nr:hypothetical protein [Tanacetum cinerariifolium]
MSGDATNVIGELFRSLTTGCVVAGLVVKSFGSIYMEVCCEGYLKDDAETNCMFDKIIVDVVQRLNFNVDVVQRIKNKFKLQFYWSYRSSSCCLCFRVFLLKDLEAVPAGYDIVPAGHVLVSADRYRIC